MKIAINTGLLFALIVLPACCIKTPSHVSQTPSDAYIRRSIVGFWRTTSTSGSPGHLTLNSNGNIESTIKGDGRPESALTFTGKWRVSNGWLLMTVADEDGKISGDAEVVSNKVVRVDTHELRLQEIDEDSTNVVVLHR